MKLSKGFWIHCILALLLMIDSFVHFSSGVHYALVNSSLASLLLATAALCQAEVK